MRESDIYLLTNSGRMTRLRDGWWKNRGSNPGSHDSFLLSSLKRPHLFCGPVDLLFRRYR